MDKRSFLFLQGPYGPFFRELGEAINRMGHPVTRINFNSGDWIDWSGPLTISYHKRLEHLPSFLADCFCRLGVTDMIVFNDSRPIHRAALLTAKEHNIRQWVFEEGYLRPYWVTLEQGGVNAHSSLPRDKEWYKQKSYNMTFPNEKKFQLMSRRFRYYKLRYYFFELAGRIKYPYYEYHREFGGTHEIASILKRKLKRRLDNKISSALSEFILSLNRPFFLLCLQIDYDTQIKLHSPFKNMNEVLIRVCESFAANAPRNSLLVVKNHPLSSGIFNHRINTKRAAQLYGISERVFYLEYGDLDRFLSSAKGVIVVNSTVGISSLFHNCPVIALGNAMYNMDGLTHQGELSTFWTKPQYPKKRPVNAFRLVLANDVCINGSYFTIKGRQSILPIAVDRILPGYDAHAES